MEFKVIVKDKKSGARAGKIRTAHGTIDTPAFVAVGTRASVKGLTPKDLKETGVQILFGNTYHLRLRPGEDVVKKFGGLGKFMGWNGPTMTDSGGFQVFSLGKTHASPHPLNDSSRPSGNTQSLSKKVPSYTAGSDMTSGSEKTMKSSFRGEARPSNMSFAKAPRAAGSSSVTDEDNETPRLVKITDDGVIFRSHLDGSLHNFTPEKSIEIQKKLGADIILTFDECAPYPSTYEYTKQAMERTHRWAERCLDYYSTSEESLRDAPSGASLRNTSEVTKGLLRGGFRQALYGIIQGGVYKDLRVESAKFISSLPFDGIAIGGVSVGESKKEMRDALDWVVPFLPDNKPLHLLGIGEIDDIFAAVERGMDTFDCVIPTRFGRYGIVFVSPPEGNIKNRFRIDINKSKFAKDKGSLSKNCKCYVCRNFTRGYINHLFRVQELLAYRLASYHNLYFINSLVTKIRNAILEGRFGEMKKEWIY